MDGHFPNQKRTLLVEFEIDRQGQTRLKQAYHRIQTDHQVNRNSKTGVQTTVAVSMADVVGSENQG